MGDICAYVYQIWSFYILTLCQGEVCTDDANANADDTNANDDGQSMIV